MKISKLFAMLLVAVLLGGTRLAAAQTTINLGLAPVGPSNPFPTYLAPGTVGTISGSPLSMSATSLPLPAGAATAALQPALNVDGGALSHITNFPSTQPVSIASLPSLPAGTNSIGTVSTAPLELPSVNGSTTITAGGTFQTILAQNSSRKGCLIQNPVTATETLYVYVYSGSTGTPALAQALSLPAGSVFSCAAGGYGVITDQIAVEAATTGHSFVELSQ